MVKVSVIILIFYVTSSWTAIENRPPSWLDRLVSRYKKEFLAEVSKLPAVPIQATIEKAPSGYVDSSAWDFVSVMRLVSLIQSSDNKPLRRAIHEALKPTRRILVAPGRNKFKLFPSLAKDHIDNFYYDGVDSEEYWASDEVNVFNASDTSAIILVSNPVEARLPSARISVNLLREILMARAVAAREMPSTTMKPSTKHVAKSTSLNPNGPSAKPNPNATDATVNPNAPTGKENPNATDSTVNPNASSAKEDPSLSQPTASDNANAAGSSVTADTGATADASTTDTPPPTT